MIIESIQVGRARELEFRGRAVRSAIFKDPVDAGVRVTRAGLDGDEQADLKVHGGVDKAVYAFSRDAYVAWPLAPVTRAGSFGENLTVDRLDEATLHLGDVLQIGTCRLEVTQPRQPCFKLGLRLDTPHAPRAFLTLGRPGAYFRVRDEGVIRAGDEVRVIERDPRAVSLIETWDFIMNGRMAPARALRALEIPGLNARLRADLEEFISEGRG